MREPVWNSVRTPCAMASFGLAVFATTKSSNRAWIPKSITLSKDTKWPLSSVSIATLSNPIQINAKNAMKFLPLTTVQFVFFTPQALKRRKYSTVMDVVFAVSAVEKTFSTAISAACVYLWCNRPLTSANKIRLRRTAQCVYLISILRETVHIYSAVVTQCTDDALVITQKQILCVLCARSQWLTHYCLRHTTTPKSQQHLCPTNTSTTGWVWFAMIASTQVKSSSMLWVASVRVVDLITPPKLGA